MDAFKTGSTAGEEFWFEYNNRRFIQSYFKWEFFAFPFSKGFYWLFLRWMCEIYPPDLAKHVRLIRSITPDLCFHFPGPLKRVVSFLRRIKAARTWCWCIRTFRLVRLTSFCVLASGWDSKAARWEGQRSGTGWLSGEPPALPDDPERRPGDGGLRSACSVRAVRSVFRSHGHLTAPCGGRDPANGNIWVCFDSTGLKNTSVLRWSAN